MYNMYMYLSYIMLTRGTQRKCGAATIPTHPAKAPAAAATLHGRFIDATLYACVERAHPSAS